MNIARLAALCAMLVVWSLPASQTAWAQAAWIADLRAGGHVIVIRHGATRTDQADTDPLNLDNVDKQRQLTDAGRVQAREMGEAFRKLGIPVGQVLTSRYFRAIETGKLAFGSAQPTPDVTEGGQAASPMGGQVVSASENNRRTAALRKLAGTVPPAGTNIVVVTHKPNIVNAFGKDWSGVREGEASIFKPDGAGGYRLVARVQVDEWANLAD